MMTFILETILVELMKVGVGVRIEGQYLERIWCLRKSGEEFILAGDKEKTGKNAEIDVKSFFCHAKKFGC